MPNYVVKLEVNCGGYEKHIVHNIGAETKQQAMLQAMSDESHGNAVLKSNGDWEDLGGEFAYCVQDCTEITKEVSEMLHKLDIYYSEYDPEYILEMIDEDAECRDIDTLLSYLS